MVEICPLVWFSDKCKVKCAVVYLSQRMIFFFFFKFRAKRTVVYLSWCLAVFQSQSQMRSDFILRKIPTNTLCMLTPLYSHCYPHTCFSPLGPSSGSTDIFHEQGQQNTYPDVNIRLKRNMLSVT
jgi:hypothetical protein